MTRRRLALSSLLACTLALASLSAAADPRPIDREPTATGLGGAAASLDPRAAETAIEILQGGGNAIDATIGAAAMLGLVRPYDGSIGGDGYMTIYLAEEDEVVTIDSRSLSPQDWDQQTMQQLSSRNARPLTVGAPGLVRGWDLALEEFGTMSFADVLAPAIDEAEGGFLVDQAYRDRTASNRTKFLDYIPSREYYLTPDLEVPEVGDVVFNPDLATTYRLIAEHGSDGFYEGPVAEAIVDAVTNPPVAPDRPEGIMPGAMEVADLAEYQAFVREPTHHNYRGYDIYGVGGSSTGGATVGQILNMMKGFDFESREELLHTYIESSRIAFADRATYIGTSPLWQDVVRVVDAPIAGVLSEEFADERRQLIGETAIPGSVPPGDPFAFDPNASGGADLSDFPGEEPAPSSTTHLSVSDRHGNIVSYTFTIVSIGGSGIAVDDFGFLLNNVLIGAVPEPDPGERGGRSYSNTAPTIAFKDGEPALTLGGPGSAQIIAAVSYILTNHIDLGMDLEEAVSTGRLSNVSPPLTTSVEGRLLNAEPELMDALRDRGHNLRQTGTISNANGIQFFPDGTVTAVAEPERLGGGGAAVEVSCDQIVTGTHVGPLTVSDGVTCLADGARVNGPVKVQSGAGLAASGARVTGPFSAADAAMVELYDTRLTGSVTVSGTTSSLTLVDNHVTAGVNLTNNSTGDRPIVVSGNRITGPLSCSGNEPPPVNDGVSNTVTGPQSGQCADL